MTEEQFVIDTFGDWSFSRINSFSTCNWEWFQHYIKAIPSANSFFGQFGTICHEILEKYENGELSAWDLLPYYEDHYYEYVTIDPPPNKYVDIGQQYYEQGWEYFANFQDYLDKYEILGVEKEIHFTIADKPFVGFIDLLVRDKSTNDIIIIDHKSAKLKLLKNGTISKTEKEHFESFKRQLYMYAKAVFEEYGEYPSKLVWNCFRMNKQIIIDFNIDEYNETIKWATETISAIEEEELWLPSPDFFYCHYLCSMRNNGCEYMP